MTIASIDSQQDIKLDLKKEPEESYFDFHKRVTSAVKVQLGLPPEAKLDVLVTIV